MRIKCDLTLKRHSVTPSPSHSAACCWDGPVSLRSELDRMHWMDITRNAVPPLQKVGAGAHEGALYTFPPLCPRSEYWGHIFLHILICRSEWSALSWFRLAAAEKWNALGFCVVKSVFPFPREAVFSVTLLVGRTDYQDLVDLLDSIIPLNSLPGHFREEQMALRATLSPAAYSLPWSWALALWYCSRA